MNNVVLIGRLTKDPEMRYTTGQNQMAVTTFTLAIDRPVRQGQESRLILSESRCSAEWLKTVTVILSRADE